jgi:transcriptional regulator with GAF, ATPase, and Fis domain
MFGLLAAASSKPDSFTEEMGEFLVEVAPHVATAVANARAYAQLNARKEDLLNEALLLRDELNALHRFGELVGASRVVEDLKDTIRRVAPTEATALILGETGTGKELVARALHDLSPRRERALVKVNCAALQDTLLLSELFGHEKGAFTGAVQRKTGRFELAHRGTIFLDEIGEISTEAQVKILRVLQEREFERVGGIQTIQVDTRIIVATNRDLEKEVREGRFRNDLFFRLNVIPIRVPSLRERKEDIPTFVDYFVEKHGPRLNRRVKRVDPKALARLMRYDWPGNIRELENVVERGLVLGKGETLTFQKQLLGDAPPLPRSSVGPEEFETLEEFERRHILSVLERTGGVVSGVQGAARILGMKPTTLTSRMKKLGIRPSRRFNILKN